MIYIFCNDLILYSFLPRERPRVATRRCARTIMRYNSSFQKRSLRPRVNTYTKKRETKSEAEYNKKHKERVKSTMLN